MPYHRRIRCCGQKPSAFAQYLTPVRQTDWVVYAKPSFGGPAVLQNILHPPRARLPLPEVQLTRQTKLNKEPAPSSS